jgi:mono/diheme cytochrome c family protein
LEIFDADEFDADGRVVRLHMTRLLGRKLRGCVLAAVTTFGCAASPAPEGVARCPAERQHLVSPAPNEKAVLTPGDPIEGRRVFQEHCARCHSPRLAERSSRLFLDYPRLDCPNYLDATSDRDITAIVLNGGKPFGLNKAMKPFADVLEAREIADVVAYIRAGAAGH